MPKRTDISSILIIGAGPIIIGQAAEFDYSGTQACKVLREEGYKVILVNSNPATIMTAPDFADRTYVEPLDVEVLIAITEEEFEKMAAYGLEASPISEILIEKSILGWKEYELEVMRDKHDNCVIICSI